MPSQKFHSALEAVIYIALNAGASPVSGKEVCAKQSVSPRHLEPIMQMLVHGGILKGTKGPKGGYTLAREKRKITAGDVYKLLLQYESDKNKAATTIIGRKVILPLGKQVESAVTALLDNMTIEDMCAKIVDSIDKPGETEEFFI